MYVRRLDRKEKDEFKRLRKVDFKYKRCEKDRKYVDKRDVEKVELKIER